MRSLLTLAILATALVGCSSSSSDEGSITPGSGVVQNPSGQPKDEQEAQYKSQLSQAGSAVNDDRAKAAAAMAAAKAASGGK
jgi:hypothetical protein